MFGVQKQSGLAGGAERGILSESFVKMCFVTNSLKSGVEKEIKDGLETYIII